MPDDSSRRRPAGHYRRSGMGPPVPSNARAVRHVLVMAMTLLLVLSVTRRGDLVRLLAGFAALGIAGDRATGRGAAGVAWRAGSSLPGAILVSANAGVVYHQRWAAAVVVTVIVAGAVLTVDLERRSLGFGTTGCLVLLSVGGIYACVPETGHLRPLAFGAAALVVLEVLGRARIGPGLTLAAVGVLAWAVVYGGTYRASALVGGFGAIGLLVIEPLARRLPGPRRALIRSRWLVPITLIALQGANALGVSRTAGLASSTAKAVALAVPWIVGLALLCRLLVGPLFAREGPTR